MGLGNVIMGDEGFGVHVAQCLKEISLSDNIRVEEGGVGGFDLLENLCHDNSASLGRSLQICTL